MNNKLQQSIISGIAGTAVMTIVMLWIMPLVGLPEMNTAAMLSMMMGFSVAIGWIMHFVIGIVLAGMYVFFFANLLKKLNNKVVKGLVFGIIAFIIGQIGMGILGAMLGGMPAMEGSMTLIMIGSVVGHLVFGVVVALVHKD